MWVDTGVLKMWFQGDLKSYKAKQGKFVFAIACPSNELSYAFKCYHLLPLEYCLSKTKIRCNEKQVWVDTGVFKMWFQGDLKSDKAKQGKFAAVPSSLQLKCNYFHL